MLLRFPLVLTAKDPSKAAEQADTQQCLLPLAQSTLRPMYSGILPALHLQLGLIVCQAEAWANKEKTTSKQPSSTNLHWVCYQEAVLNSWEWCYWPWRDTVKRALVISVRKPPRFLLLFLCGQAKRDCFALPTSSQLGFYHCTAANCFYKDFPCVCFTQPSLEWGKDAQVLARVNEL